jgi:hypothetical protein
MRHFYSISRLYYYIRIEACYVDRVCVALPSSFPPTTLSLYLERAKLLSYSEPHEQQQLLHRNVTSRYSLSSPLSLFFPALRAKSRTKKAKASL